VVSGPEKAGEGRKRFRKLSWYAEGGGKGAVARRFASSSREKRKAERRTVEGKGPVVMFL